MTRVVAVLLTTLFLLPCNAIGGEIATKFVEAAVDAGFSELERQLIEKYYGKRPQVTQHEEVAGSAAEEQGGKEKPKVDKHAKKNKDKGLPPGLAKRDQLPPGLAKRDTLPPGLAKRALPQDLDRQLPPPPEGYERRIVDDVDQAVIVLVDRATGKVADIIKDVIIPSSHD